MIKLDSHSHSLTFTQCLIVKPPSSPTTVRAHRVWDDRWDDGKGGSVVSEVLLLRVNRGVHATVHWSCEGEVRVRGAGYAVFALRRWRKSLLKPSCWGTMAVLPSGPSSSTNKRNRNMAVYREWWLGIMLQMHPVMASTLPFSVDVSCLWNSIDSTDFNIFVSNILMKSLTWDSTPKWWWRSPGPGASIGAREGLRASAS